jgi:hypothetical protein
MADIVSTTPNLPWYRQRTTLDGRDYVLTIYWNERNGRWYMDIADQDDVPLAMGVKLVADLPLLRLYRDDRLPQGQLMVVDMAADENLSRDPGICHLGDRFKLVYIPIAELAELVGA